MLSCCLLLLFAALDPGWICTGATGPWVVFRSSRGSPSTPSPQQCLLPACTRLLNLQRQALQIPLYGQSLTEPLCLPRQKGQVPVLRIWRWWRKPVLSLTRTDGGGHRMLCVGRPASSTVSVSIPDLRTPLSALDSCALGVNLSYFRVSKSKYSITDLCTY